MKFRTVVFVFIIIVILIGVFTKPDRDAFIEYYSKQSGINTPPVIEYKNGIAYSIFTITTYSVADNGNKKMAFTAGKAKYLGLFGRFWKID
ncbi:MAG: hypothetical protein DI535_29090 [Citrobacter freundii]|nr:MAG: hypothetical protein DI535_29090 [Citrobacter freundii]